MKKMIRPFVGVGEYMLLSSHNSIIEILNKHKITYHIEKWDNNNCTPAVQWVIIHANNNINFFFANDKLFKIYIDGKTDYSLENGIFVGISMKEAEKLDPKLQYDDCNEDWRSEDGYWIEDNIEDDSVMSISIFIKEVLDEDLFEKYEW